MKYILTVIIALMLSVSCIEDEFGNVAGTWLYPAMKSGESKKIPPKVDNCERNITTTFHKNLTGTLDKDKLCSSNHETNSFIYNIKGDKLTITYDHQSASGLNFNSGLNTYIISGNELTLTNEDGTITVLTKY